MGRADTANGHSAENDAGAPVRAFAVIIGEHAGGTACRVAAPGRLLRIWSLLQATQEQIADAALLPAGMPRLQRQLQAIRRELETSVSPPLAAELRRIAPPRDEAPSAAGLRIECAALTSWTGSLTMQMLSTLEAAGKRLSPQPAATPKADAAAAADPPGSAAARGDGGRLPPGQAAHRRRGVAGRARKEQPGFEPGNVHRWLPLRGSSYGSRYPRLIGPIAVT